jgi:glycosyltransferase involved in cell wall biosynthesis
LILTKIDKPMTISVLILTLNEEDNLPLCLSSLAWCDDVVILDSYSDDHTEKISIKAKARFFQRQFDNYAAQRNYGLNSISYKYDWLLMVDADETVPVELVEEMRNAIEHDDTDTTIYRMRRKDHFLGKWIKRSSGYPTWFGRLVKIGEVQVEREINEEYVTDGKIDFLQEHLFHYPFNKGLSSWFDKHNRYSSMEAKLLCGNGFTTPSFKKIFSTDPVDRRKAIKALVYKIPGRPFAMFFALYIVKGGFLDGRAGLIFSLLRAFYEFMINCKVRELKDG